MACLFLKTQVILLWVEAAVFGNMCVEALIFMTLFEAAMTKFGEMWELQGASNDRLF